MKKLFIFIALTVWAASCANWEEDTYVHPMGDVEFYASFEQPEETETKVYANEDYHLRWNEDDRVSIFNKTTSNQQYRFSGLTGDDSGEFAKVDVEEFMTGNPIQNVVSVYPYQKSTIISENEDLSITLPAEQRYAENSFGIGANTMVSVSSDNVLFYKNVCGYLRIRLYGEGVSVSSIILKGNNGEKLAGRATVSMPLDGTPTVVMADDAIDKITLICDSPVALGATQEESTDFWFVLPPVKFSQGFTISVFGLGDLLEKSTSKSITIERNHLSQMAPIEVRLSQPNNVIYYTSSDGNIVEPSTTGTFGASIISNEYVDGIGMITFSDGLTVLGDCAFCNCSNLTSIILPNGVTSISFEAFWGCSSLTSIIIPQTVTEIGRYAFYDCNNLKNIIIPNAVTSIGESAFRGCSSLSGITIPETVTSIGFGAFAYCSSLLSFTGKYASHDGMFLIDSGILLAIAIGAFDEEVVIPEDVNSIGDYALQGCSNLTTIILPNGVTSIGNFSFEYCSNLTGITIPEGVTNIGKYAFHCCSNLIGITIPEGVTSIRERTFGGCSNLTRVCMPESITSIGDGAFYYCANLLDITIPKGVTAIGGYAFCQCFSLKNIVIPNGVRSIGESAFRVCNFTNIIIPESVKSIGESAFQGCYFLTRITVLSEMPPWGGDKMFLNTNNAPIYVPSGSVDLYLTTGFWEGYADRIRANESSIKMNTNALTLLVGEIATLSATVLPEGEANVGVVWTSSNTSVVDVSSEGVVTGLAKGEATITVTAKDESGMTAQCHVFVLATYPSMVDLGLSVKWGTCNVGASEPEDFGYYLAWGEIAPMTEYSWSIYKWCMGSRDSLTKYCTKSNFGYYGFTDNKTILDLEDDAAHVILGGKWRIPTDEEWRELRENCSWTWTDINGVEGDMVTSNIAGYTDKWIFLPAAGYMDQYGLHNYGGHGRTYGRYWSSSLYTDYPYVAWTSYFNSSDVGYWYDNRTLGKSVRPILAE